MLFSNLIAHIHFHLYVYVVDKQTKEEASDVLFIMGPSTANITQRRSGSARSRFHHG